MPRKLVVHFECERCGREWFEKYDEGKELPEAASFDGTLVTPQGEQRKIAFDCLCESCENTVNNYFDGIAKTRAKKEAQTEESEPKEREDDVEVELDDVNQ